MNASAVIEKKVDGGGGDDDANERDAGLRDYRDEILASLLAKQDAVHYYVDANYFHMQTLTTITPANRFICLEWMTELATDLRISRDALWLGVYIFDRFLTCTEFTRSANGYLQLLAMTSLFMADKHEDVSPNRLFVYLDSCVDDDKELYTRQEAQEMELSILDSLDGRLAPPTSLLFLRIYTFDLNLTVVRDRALYLLTRYYAEAALLCAPMLQFSPNVTACGCIFLARRASKQVPHWPSALFGASKVGTTDVCLAANTLERCLFDLKLNENKILQRRHQALWDFLRRVVPKGDQNVTHDASDAIVVVQ